MLDITVEFEDGKKSHFRKRGDLRFCERVVGKFVKEMEKKGLKPVKITIKSRLGTREFCKYA